MFYHPFKKTVKSKAGKTTKRWYYWWKDPITGIQHQKLIPNVSNQSEAYVEGIWMQKLFKRWFVIVLLK